METGDLKSIQRFLENHDLNTPDESGTMPIVHAVDTGNTEVVRLLLERGAKPNDDSLLHAAEKGFGKILELLIKHGVNIHARDGFYGKTALLIAIENGKEDVVDKLIDNGADVNKINDKSFARLSALHWAAIKGSLFIAKKLVDSGAFLNPSDYEGKTPLHWSIFGRKDEVSDFLINNGASVNQTDNAGLTPLHVAASTGAELTAKLLIKNGANVLATDHTGKTPADIANNSGFGDWHFLNPNNGYSLFSNIIVLLCLVCGALFICVR